MNTIFQELRDPNVQVPPISGEDFVEWGLRVFPKRVFEEGLRTKAKFSLNSDGELELKVMWQDTENLTETENVVETINGMSVPDAVRYLANSRATALTSPSVGGRVNQLLKEMISKRALKVVIRGTNAGR